MIYGPKKNAAFTFSLPLVTAGSDDWKLNPTLAAGDFKVSIDGGALANLATLPTNNPAGSAWVTFALSAAEMNGDRIQVQAIDQGTKEWKDTGEVIFTRATTLNDHTAQTGDCYPRLGAPAGASIAADLASIKQDTIPVFRGYAVSGSANTIILAPGSVEFDDQYAGMIATVVAGTGRRQSGKIMATSASTHSLTLDEPTGVLDGTSLIEITTAVLRDLDSRLSVMQAKMTDLINALANNTLTLASTTGVAVSGTVSTIVLAVGASAVDDFYNGWLVTIADTTGNTFIGFVSDYVGATRTLHIVRSTWANAFAGTIIYGLVQKVFVAYAYDQDGNDIPTAPQIADAVHDEQLSGHTTAGSAGKAIADGVGPSAAAIADAVHDEALSGHTTAGTAGKALSDAAAGGGGGSAIGSGSEDVEIVVLDDGDLPIAGVDVWVTSTNDPRAVVVAGTLRTDDSGIVSFMLDPGTFYVWKQKSGVNFTNPQTIVVEDE